MDAARLKFYKAIRCLVTLRKFISEKLYCKTFNHNMVINLQLFTKANQWDITFLGATKRTKALQFVSQTNIYILIWFNAMIDSRPLHCQ